MPDNEQTVTPAEEPQEIAQEETTVEEADTQTEEATEESTEKKTVEPTEEAEPEVDNRREVEALKREVEQMKAYIRSREDEPVKDDDMPKIPVDVKEFLTEFAEKPQETLKKVIDGAVKPYQRALLEVQQQQAIDYIRGQKDFEPKMYDEILYIIEGPDRNRYFNYANQSFKLKDLPPRQKAEAALQIYRELSKSKQSSTTQSKERPKPPVTTKAKPTKKDTSKSDDMLSAEEFAKKHGIKLGSL